VGILRFLIKLFQIILYIPIQIIFIPFAIIGVIDGIYKEMGKSKKLSVSFSAIKALQYRWAMHYFNTRPDPLSVAFTKKFPCESHFGLWSTFGALIIFDPPYFDKKAAEYDKKSIIRLVSLVAVCHHHGFQV